MRIINYAICALALLAFASCKDDKKIEPTKDPDPTTATGTVAMKFENYVGSSLLDLNSLNYYQNEHGDNFRVSRYKYYVSNIVLKGENGISYTEAESYHLLDQEDKSTLSFNMANVPAGKYTSMQLMIGVDSLRNVSGAQTGALDPAHGMFWTWNSGYIMAKVEGTSPQVPTASQSISFHIGGFAGSFNATHTIQLPLPNTMTVTDASSNKVTVKADLLAWFKAPNLIDFSTLYSIGTEGTESAQMSVNYSNMFTVTQAQ
jgi:hypothetical protein